MNQVENTLAKIKASRVNKTMEFQTIIDNAVKQLGCDANCVNNCSALALTIDTKAMCLDTCLCYATIT